MRIIRKGFLIALGLLAVAILALVFGEPLWRGILLRHTILRAIKSASTVRAVEHTNRHDTPFLPKEHYKEEIYLSRTLLPHEIKELKKAFSISFDYSGSIFKGCIFNDHHRIEAEKSDGTIFRLRICFNCGELAVNQNEKRIFPVRWNTALRSFFTKIGMHPDGPWKVNLEAPETSLQNQAPLE